MSESVLTIVSTITIDRPLERVRAQFFDIDHAIRDGVHEGVKMRWLPPRAPGERRLRQEVRVLGMPQVDELLVEQGEGGALVKRFVEGPNKGTVFHESFHPVGPEQTRVEILATVPTSGFKWAIGPLFKIAVKKALDRALAEHKRDIEGSYEPGRARGNLDAALAPVRDVLGRAGDLRTDEQRMALVAPMLEAACVTAIADDEVDDAERDAIRAVVRVMGVALLDDDAVEAIVTSSIDRTRSEGIERRCDELGERLKKLGIAEPGLSVATLVAQVSHGIDQSELAILQRMARAAGVPDEALVALIDRVDAQLMAAG